VLEEWSVPPDAGGYHLATGWSIDRHDAAHRLVQGWRRGAMKVIVGVAAGSFAIVAALALILWVVTGAGG
jgi:adenine/guanine phosphoribosyltransferase-like PRPP-binding protein